MKTPTVLVLILALAACTKEPAPVAPAPPATKTKQPALGRVPSADEYSVSLEPRVPYEAGKEATAVILVTARAGYHVNPEYPMAFKAQGQVGLHFAEQNFKLTWGPKTPCPAKAEDACVVEVPLKLTPEQAGPATVAGLVAFSVCNPEHCLIEKVPLTLAIDVR
jgi:hypothetical protein